MPALVSQFAVDKAGYDIIISAGQSNEFYGTGFDAGLDVSDSRIYQFPPTPWSSGAGSGGPLSAASANDPLDYPDTTNKSPANTYIGHAVHFCADNPAGYLHAFLRHPRKIIIVPAAFGGAQVMTNAASNLGVYGGTTALTTANAISATNAALALSGANRVKAILWTQGEGDYQAYGNTAQYATVSKYRAYLLSVLNHYRIQYPNVPIVLSRLASYSIDAGSVRFSTNGLAVDAVIRSIPTLLPYTAVVDSQSPSALGASDVHFTAAEQRTLATRFEAAYAAALANTSPAVTWDAIGGGTHTWFASAIGAFTFANGNLDVSGDATAGWKTILATGSRTGGKLYFEVKVQSLASAVNLGMVGLANSYNYQGGGYLGDASLQISATTTFAGGAKGSSAGVWGYTAVTPNTAVGDWTVANSGVLPGSRANQLNDVIMFAVDFSSGKAWVGRNGTWATGDPAAGTLPWLTGVSGRVFIGASPYSGSTNVWRLNAGASAFAYTPPSGFSAWKDGTP